MSKPQINFTSHVFTSPSSLADASMCDILFLGPAVDDRGEAVLSELSMRAKTVITLGFNNLTLFVNGIESSAKKLARMLKSEDVVRFESTTLGLAEILRGLQAVKEAKIDSVEVCYIEPKFYSNHDQRQTEILSSREFELTTNSAFVGLQGFNAEYRDGQQAHHVYFLGYESSRLLQAFEQRGEYNSINYHRFFVIGVPAFSPGWENNVLANHVQILQRLGITANAIRYCTANSITEGYHLLWDMYKDIGNESSTFWVSPFGTKPHTFASALFLLETKGAMSNSSLFYDHPVRTNKRSEKIAKYHFVKISGLQDF